MPFHIGTAADERNVVEIYDLECPVSESSNSS